MNALRRRLLMLSALLAAGLARADDSLRRAMQRAAALRDSAVRAGDQPYGAVVVKDGAIVGEAPSRVITANNPDAHAEREALKDALRRLNATDLEGCVLVSTSRPCRLCEAAAARVRIARMIHGEALTDAGRPA